MPPEVQNPEVRQAIERAREAVLGQPHSAEAWGELAMTLHIHQFYPEADQSYAEAALLDSTDPRWPYGRGLIALKRDPPSAIPFLRQATQCSSQPEIQLIAMLQLGEALLEQHAVEEAREVLIGALAREKDNPRALYDLGLVAVARGDDEAVQLLRQVSNSPYFRKQTTAQLAALARARGDLTAGNLEIQVANFPEDTPWPDPFVLQLVRRRVDSPTRETEAETLERQQRFAEAANVYLRQIEARPTTGAYIGAGLNLARSGDRARALPLLREAVKRDSDNPNAHFALAVVLVVIGEKELKQSPQSSVAKEAFREVIEHTRRTTELKPDHAHAYLYWGVALKSLGDPAGALAPLRRGVACRPTDLDLQVTLGEVLADLGEFDEAWTAAENARLINPTDPRPAAILARLPTRGR
jgi:tetratricopeptide (TPR) repeat protein